MNTSKYLVGKTVREVKLPDLPDFMDTQMEDGLAAYQLGHLGLHNDMGTGKTLTALYALTLAHDEQFELHNRYARTIIIVPSIAIRNWVSWLSAVLRAYYPSESPSVQLIKSGSDEIGDGVSHVILTYGMVSRRGSKIVKRLREFNAEVIILDEADTLSSMDSVRTEVIFGSYKVYGLAHPSKARWVWTLTGTPMRRYADGLFPWLRNSYLDTLKKYDLGSYKKFLDMFCYTKSVRYPGMRFAKLTVAGSKNLGYLRQIIYEGQLAVRRKLEDVAAFLPPISYRDVDVDFDKSVELDEATEVAMQKGFAIDEDSGELIEVQGGGMTSALRLYGIAKAHYVADYIAEVLEQKREAGDKTGVLCLFIHTDAGEAIQSRLLSRNIVACIIDGSTQQRIREEIEDDFNDGKVNVVIGQIIAMGTALNLQGNCRHVVMAEKTWSDTANQQAIARVYRMGQSQHVQVDYCIGDSPLEDPKIRVTERKHKEASKLVD